MIVIGSVGSVRDGCGSGGDHGFTGITCFCGRLSSSTLLLLLMVDWTECRATTAACISRHVVVVVVGGDDDGEVCYLVWKLLGM